MSNEERRRKAEALVRLSTSGDGFIYFKELQHDFDTAMQALLYADAASLQTAQGAARALHEQLKKFSDARLHLERT